MLSRTTVKLCEILQRRDEEGFELYHRPLEDRHMKLHKWLEESIEEQIDNLQYMYEAYVIAKERDL